MEVSSSFLQRSFRSIRGLNGQKSTEFYASSKSRTSRTQHHFEAIELACLYETILVGLINLSNNPRTCSSCQFHHFKSHLDISTLTTQSPHPEQFTHSLLHCHDLIGSRHKRPNMSRFSPILSPGRGANADTHACTMPCTQCPFD